jgi:hypothetical protein
MIEQFTRDGFVKLTRVVDVEVADAARELLWERIGLSPDGPWTEPVVWTNDFTNAGPFGRLTSSPVLIEALDQLCGPGGWVRRFVLGNIPVRFPVLPAADDRGWHIDANTPVDDGTWAVTGNRDAAAVLGPEPVEFTASGPLLDRASADRPVATATGQAGDMYLVHPFTVHAADEHRGTRPRFMAQTPILLTEPLSPDRSGPLVSAWHPE